MLLLVKEKASDISRRTLNITNGKTPNDIVKTQLQGTNLRPSILQPPRGILEIPVC